jgi:two-component system, chemotaxis family, sensor kinase CheA
MKVFLLDDDTFLLDMYAAKFTATGHEVVTAKSVEEALEKLRHDDTFNAVLMDMILPGMTGLDFLNAMRTQGLAKSAKLIVLSNQGDQSDIDSAKVAGAHGYIIKAHMIPSEVVARVITIVEKNSTL